MYVERGLCVIFHYRWCVFRSSWRLVPPPERLCHHVHMGVALFLYFAADWMPWSRLVCLRVSRVVSVMCWIRGDFDLLNKFIMLLPSVLFVAACLWKVVMSARFAAIKRSRTFRVRFSPGLGYHHDFMCTHTYDAAK